MNKMLKHSTRPLISGFTLVEILISSVIFAMLVGALYSVFSVGNAAWVKYDCSIATQRQARQALSQMTKELREASSISITQTTDNATISFYRSGVGSISYIWNATGTNAKRILRSYSAIPTIVAEDISALAFTDHSNAVTIELTSAKQAPTGGTLEFSLKEKVALR